MIQLDCVNVELRALRLAGIRPYDGNLGGPQIHVAFDIITCRLLDIIDYYNYGVNDDNDDDAVRLSAGR